MIVANISDRQERLKQVGGKYTVQEVLGKYNVGVMSGCIQGGNMQLGNRQVIEQEIIGMQCWRDAGMGQ